MLLIWSVNTLLIPRSCPPGPPCPGSPEFPWVIDITTILGVVGVLGTAEGIWPWLPPDMTLTTVGVPELMERGLSDCPLLLGREVMTINFCCPGVLGVLGCPPWIRVVVPGVRMAPWVCFGVPGRLPREEDCWMTNWDRGWKISNVGSLDSENNWTLHNKCQSATNPQELVTDIVKI